MQVINETSTLSCIFRGNDLITLFVINIKKPTGAMISISMDLEELMDMIDDNPIMSQFKPLIEANIKDTNRELLDDIFDKTALKFIIENYKI